MEKIILCPLEDLNTYRNQANHIIIYAAPCEKLYTLQQEGACVIAELSYLQGCTETEIAEALDKDKQITLYQHVCINAKELPEAYLRRIWCKSNGIPVLIEETERLWIRESIPEDAEGFFRLYCDPACQTYLEKLPVPEMEQDSCKAYIQSYADNQYSFYEYGMWTVLEKETGNFVGRMGLESYSDETLSLGYALLPDYRGKGYALEACLAILDYCEECEYAEHIVIKADPENKNSLKLAKRLQKENRTELELHVVVK